jgi:hypothetical protein
VDPTVMAAAMYDVLFWVLVIVGIVMVLLVAASSCGSKEN